MTQSRFQYADYERAIRGRYYTGLRQISRETASRFQGCCEVLDIASGQGFMLDALTERNISAQGVDSEPELVAECRGRGLRVTQDDVMHFLQTTEARFDGAYCGHLIEHLPFDAVLDLLEGAVRVLLPGGLIMLRWPNPRSAITQHYTFWQDPTHVRFYDGDFVVAALEHYGFSLVETHYNTVSPAAFAPPSRGTGSDPQHTVPAPSGKQRARRWVGNVLRFLKSSAGRQGGPGPRLAALFETLYTRRQFATMNTLIFKLPVEAYIIARRGTDTELIASRP